MTQIRITPDSIPQLERILKRKDPKVVWGAIRKDAQGIAQQLASRVVKTSLSGQRLRRRTGTLARSVVGRADATRGVPTIRVGVFRGPALAYAAIQETGGTITPKQAGALAIPQAPALTRAGVDRFGGPRGYPGELRLIPFRNSGVAQAGLFDAQEIKDSGLEGARAIYILVQRVKIKPTYWLSRPVRDALPMVAAELGSILSRSIVGGR